MTEKRFELNVNQHNQCDIVDLVESKEKNAICIYNDLGDYYFSSAKALCELLNKLHEKNYNLRESRRKIITANNQYRKKLDELKNENEQLKQQLNYIQNSISEHIKHQKTELGQKALKEIIVDYNEWLLGHKRALND